jgi:hypothetical protein
MLFEDLLFKDTVHNKGIQAKVSFDNRYGASVVKTDRSYGGKDGLYELAVLFDGHICYDTPITNDVIGFLTEDEVTELLQKIEAL